MSKSFEINQQTFPKDRGEIILYQRADHKKPKWQTRIKISGSTGYIRKSCKTTDEFKARKFAENLYDSLVDKFRDTGSTQTKTFKSVVDEWLNGLVEKDTKPELIKEFRDRLYNYPVRYWGDKWIDAIQDADLTDFIDWRKKNGKKGRKPSNATIKKDLVPLNQVLKYAYGKKYISRPLKFEKFKTKSKRRPDFSAKEWQTILQKLDEWIKKSKKHPRSYRDRIYLKYFILIIGNTGIRAGTESRAITWNCLENERVQDVEHEVLAIRIRSGKQGARSVVPHRSVQRYLIEIRKIREKELLKLNMPFNKDEPIFCHENGKVIHTFKKGFKSFLTHYGLLKNQDGEERVPYSLRHTFATRYIHANKISHWDLAKYMGTSVEELERYYVHDDHTKTAGKFLNSDAPRQRATLFNL
jgi:integrase